MAHLLEHMLFLGTERFPEPDAYRTYITANGGSQNAYTAHENTNYYFEIESGALEGALERFGQFFTAPLMDARYVERERHAVHATRGKERTYTSRVKLPGGSARVGAVFVNDHYDPKHRNPAQRDRNLAVEWIEVVAACGGEMCEPVDEPCGRPPSESDCEFPPSVAELERGFADMTRKIEAARAAGERVQFVFYYSGHSDETGLLLAGVHLDYKRLRQLIDKVPAEVRIGILDSCSSGAFTRFKGGMR